MSRRKILRPATKAHDTRTDATPRPPRRRDAPADRLFELLRAELPGADGARELLEEFLRHAAYSEEFSARLVSVARGAGGEPWETRRLAALMLEHQALRIPAARVEEFDRFLSLLKLKPEGLGRDVNPALLREGFTRTDARGFIDEFRRKLARSGRLHGKLSGRRSTTDALSDFLRLSRRECRLQLARYLFGPDEVVERALGQLRTTRGLVDLNPAQAAYVDEEAARAVARLPEFEAAIVERLRAASGVYWVADATSSEINSLVEYPLTTVVLVLKPPGSEHEFEFKRAGRRGARPLGVVYARDGNAVPPSHRLDGGSAQWLLRYESNASAKFARLYRLVHGDDAPVSSCVSRRTVYAVPGDGGERNLLDYFTERHVFGEGFDEMRAAMRECVEAFLRENSAEPLGLPGDIGRTAQFLTHAAPTQAVLVNTSSFRLDRLAAYLAPDGPKTYFTEGLRVSYSRRDARRFADELLDEILCVYEPPPVAYKNHAQYVAAALAVAANRRRADENFLAVMRQTATLWGTLLAMRGNSSGESFVARNVGLRSVWEAGRWRIKILYMDHDNLVVPDQSVADFHSLGAHQGTALDELFIWSFWEGRKWTVGAVECLESIYRAGPELSREGRRQFDDALAAAYRETQDALDTNAELRQFFNAKFLERMRDWDAVVRGYLDRRHDAERLAGWKEQTLAALTPKGYNRNVLVEHFVAAERFAAFFEKYSFLYSGELNNDDESA